MSVTPGRAVAEKDLGKHHTEGSAASPPERVSSARMCFGANKRLSVRWTVDNARFAAKGCGRDTMIGGMVGRPGGSKENCPLVIVEIRRLGAFSHAQGLALPSSGDGERASPGNVVDRHG